MLTQGEWVQNLEKYGDVILERSLNSKGLFHIMINDLGRKQYLSKIPYPNFLKTPGFSFSSKGPIRFCHSARKTKSLKF